MDDDKSSEFYMRQPGKCPMPENHDQIVEDLTLMLIYLCSWLEKPYPVRRAWKGYDFDVLNHLADRELISDSKTSKSVHLTEEGENHAQALLRKYGLLPGDD